MKTGENKHGFRIESVAELPDVGGRLWRMTYLKNGADLLWLERKDDVKTFSIVFKTLPDDETGVAHILEHSVLAGSRRYPVRSPFEEIRKSSPCVYINASTGRDMTDYYFSTRNSADFLNLADVYLDAVLHPLSVSGPRGFQQEGWHYETDPETGALSYNGVVYNEMRGVYAEPGSIAFREVMNGLYPDTVYGRDSGGTPRKIPSLTWERYKDFHARFYHPSNAHFFLDGSVDIDATLAKIDSFLRDYDRRSDFTDIPLQPPCRAERTVEYPSATTEGKTLLCLGWSAGTSDDPSLYPALCVLSEYFCGSNESPLKRVLLERGLCEDASLFCCDYRQNALIMFLRNVADGRAGECEEAVRRTLESEIAKGLDAKRILAIIDSSEFSEREMAGSYPRGLSYLDWAMRFWWCGMDPAEAFRITEKFARLRADAKSGRLERIVRDCILKNSHSAKIVLAPSTTLAGRLEKEAKEEMDRLAKTLSAASLAHIMADAAALKAYQKEKDSPEDLAKIPHVAVADLDPVGPRIGGRTGERDGDTYIVAKAPVDEIAYLTLCFPADFLDGTRLLEVPMLSRLFCKLATAKRGALELQTEIDAAFGRFGVWPSADERGNFIRVDTAFLKKKFEKALPLLREVVMETRFDDVAAIAKVLRQSTESAERAVSSNGQSAAICSSAAGFARKCASRDVMSGLSQLRWLQGAYADERLAGELASLRRDIFTRGGLVVAHTDNLTEREVASVVECFPKSAAEKSGTKGDVSTAFAGWKLRPRGLQVAADTGYSGWAAHVPGACCGSMRVALRMLSLGFLHHEVRELGGAYGVGACVRRGDVLEGYSYRDPSPLKSLCRFPEMARAIRDFAKGGESVDRYVVSTMSQIDPYRSPADEAQRPLGAYLAGETQEDVDRMRREVLTTTKKDLLAAAEMLDAAEKTAQSCAVGDARRLADLPPDLIEPVVSGAQRS